MDARQLQAFVCAGTTDVKNEPIAYFKFIFTRNSAKNSHGGKRRELGIVLCYGTHPHFDFSVGCMNSGVCPVIWRS